MPTFTSESIHLLYLSRANRSNSRTGRMAAKGCAQPAVWKNARRHFYWALRARLARNAALSAIAEASPDSLPAYRSRLLDSLIPTDVDQNDKRKLAEALEAIDITTTVNSVRQAEITHKIVELAASHRKATLEGMLRVIDTLTEEEKAAITGALHASSGGKLLLLCTPTKANQAPGPPSYSHP